MGRTIAGAFRVLVPFAIVWAYVAAEPRAAVADDAWAPAMKAVHEKFKGKPGTFAHFGDSITVSRAFWSGLRHARNNASPEMNRAFELVSEYMLEDCWDWKGPEYGNEGRMTIRWARQNVDNRQRRRDVGRVARDPVRQYRSYLPQ